MLLTLSDDRRSSVLYPARPSVPSMVKNLGHHPPPRRIATIPFNKNPSNSNKTRTADSSTCNRSPSIRPNSSDRTAPDVPHHVPPPFPPVSLRFDLLRRVPPRCSSAQHTAKRPRHTSEKPLRPRRSLFPYLPNRLPAKFFSFCSQIFPASTDPFALKCLCT